MKQYLLSFVGLAALLVGGTAEAKIISAAQGRAYYAAEDTCFLRNSQGRITTVGNSCSNPAPGPEAHYWDIEIPNDGLSTAFQSRSFWVYGRSTPASACGVGDCTTRCSAIVNNQAGDYVTWTGYFDMPTSEGWRALPSLGIGAGDVHTVQIQCLLSNANFGATSTGYISAVKYTAF